MRLPRLSSTPAALALAVGGLLGGAETASAAWDNVFQVCCNDCGRRSASYYAPAPAVSYYAAPAPACGSCSSGACPTACPTACCPQPVARVSYVQRCYYQPVTTYQSQSYYEPVQREYTSYYYEPVTSYRYTTYYDPCTGCPQRVCSPCTSYRLRSQCNSVTSYVQRCALVPVTTLKPVTVQQPVVSYYYPACPTPSCDSCSASLPAGAAAPRAVEERDTAPSTLPPANNSTIPPTTVPTAPATTPPTPMTPGTSYQRSLPAPATNPSSNVRLRPERTTSRNSLHVVRGEVVLNDQVTPRAGAKLVFVNADNQATREYATANTYGEFDVRLPAGKWYLYVGTNDGKASYHKQVTIGDRDTYDYRLVSR